MRDELQTFLEHSTAENYRCARSAILSSFDGDAGTDELAELVRIHREGRYENARQKSDAMMPAWALSPRVHYLAAEAARQLKNDEDHELEAFLWQTCLQGILSTGDGSQAHPYLVTHLSDEYDVLDVLQREADSQALVETGKGRYDVITCCGGSEIWFDVTDLVVLEPMKRQQLSFSKLA